MGWRWCTFWLVFNLIALTMDAFYDRWLLWITVPSIVALLISLHLWAKNHPRSQVPSRTPRP